MTPSSSAAQQLPGGRDAHQICSTCRWGWHFEDPEFDPAYAIGECHRHAPRPNMFSTAGPPDFRSLWPVVHGSQGCGDWTTRFLD